MPEVVRISLQPAARLHSVHLGHHHIADDDVHAHRGGDLKGPAGTEATNVR